MKIRFSQLRHVIKRALTEATVPQTRDLPRPDGYRYGDEDSLMLDQEGMEKSDRENVKRYLIAMGMLKV